MPVLLELWLIAVHRYIKELADRINSIEGKLASEGGSVDSLHELLGGSRRESADVCSPSTSVDDASRKRPFSSMSGGDWESPLTSRQSAWSLEGRSTQPEQDLKLYSADGLAPQPLTKAEPSPPSPMMDALSLDLHETVHDRELTEDAFNVYLNVVHPWYPFLASCKTGLENHLLFCPALLRHAFFESLDCAMQSFVSSPGLYTDGDVSTAARLVTDWEGDLSPRSPTSHLVHLQTLILLAIATDNQGPSSLRGTHGGASKASVLGRCVGLAYTMRLHVPKAETSDADAEALDCDSVGNVAIKAWWTLIMLDRWNAIATASPLFIPNDSVVIMPSLAPLLGDGVYHLIRECLFNLGMSFPTNLSQVWPTFSGILRRSRWRPHWQWARLPGLLRF